MTSHESLSRVTLPDDPVRRLIDGGDWHQQNDRSAVVLGANFGLSIVFRNPL